jgi:hypothetical protein
MSDLDQCILDAHARGDGAALARLYHAAAEHENTPEAKAFFLTQAYVFALEANAPEVPELRALLVALGRESA